MLIYNCYVEDNQVHLIYYDADEKKMKHVTEYYKPKVATHLPLNADSPYKDIYGAPVKKSLFGSIADYNKETKDSYDYLGTIHSKYQFISEFFRGKQIQPSTPKVWSWDIEVYSPDRFPLPEQAKYEINSIAIENMETEHCYVFSLKPYTPKQNNIHYKQCDTEMEILEKFVKFLQVFKVQAITGWNIDYFDIPYTVKRMKKYIKSSEILRNFLAHDVYEGRTIKFKKIQMLDYQVMYKQYNNDLRENYKLDYIADIECGLRKKEYEGSLAELYNKNFESFIDYNIWDCHLVTEINKKRRFLSLVFVLSCLGKCLAEDYSSPIRSWDVQINDWLLERNKFSPPNIYRDREQYLGGYVEDPELGLHFWMMMFDITSSYPTQEMQYNISPETKTNLPPVLKKLLEGRTLEENIEYFTSHPEKLKQFKEELKARNITMTLNGQAFKKDFYGFIPTMIQELFEKRMAVKKEIKRISQIIKDYEEWKNTQD